MNKEIKDFLCRTLYVIVSTIRIFAEFIGGLFIVIYCGTTIICIPILCLEGLTFVQAVVRILNAYEYLIVKYPLQSTLMVLFLIYEGLCKESILREAFIPGIRNLIFGVNLGPRPTTEDKKNEEEKSLTTGNSEYSGMQPFRTGSSLTRSMVDYVDEFKYKMKTLLQEDMNSKEGICPNGKGAIYKLCEEYEGKVQYGYITRVREIAFWLEEYFVNCKHANTSTDTALVDKLLEFDVF